MRTRLVLSSCLALGLLSSAARADLAPPPGVKRVSYQFKANVTGDTASQVVFSFPCSGSNGAPGRQVTVLTGQGVSIGSHESCSIYAVSKTAYDAWAKDAGSNVEWTMAQSLVDQAKPCTGAHPSPPGTVVVADPRSSITDVFDVKVDKGSCTVTAHAPDPSSSPAPPSAEPKKGCNASGSSPGALFLALPALLLLLKKRRG